MKAGGGKFMAGWLLMASSLLVLSGCTAIATKIPSLMGDLQGETRENNWNQLRKKNHAAADNLLQGSNKRIDAGKPVELIRLINLGDHTSNEVAPIAYFIPQQVGNRLAKLGLRIVQPEIGQSLEQQNQRVEGAQPKPLELTRPQTVQDPQKRRAGRLYLEGDYVYLRQDLFISLRLVEGGSHEIIATTEYDVPVEGDIYTLLDPDYSGGGLFGRGWMR